MREYAVTPTPQRPGRGEGGRRGALEGAQKPLEAAQTPTAFSEQEAREGPPPEYLEHSGGHRAAALVVEGGRSVADDSGKGTHRHYSRRES